jgi:hypothetical protein
MRKIMLNNMAAGFPADETFVRTVDEHRECLQQVCRGLFGSNDVILSGVEQQVEGGVTVLTEGYVWLNGDLRHIGRTKFEHLVLKEHIWLGVTGETLMGVYYNGEEKACYDDDWCYAVESENPGLPGAILHNYKKFKRVKPLELVEL